VAFAHEPLAAAFKLSDQRVNLALGVGAVDLQDLDLTAGRLQPLSGEPSGGE
jgi:hypothetical protein